MRQSPVLHLTVLAILTLFSTLNAQEPNWRWLEQASGRSTNYPTGIATDALANVLLFGTYIDSITIGDTLLTGTTGHTMFLAKYDADGDFLWARSGIGFIFGEDIAVDQAGNAYISGVFSGTATIGDSTFTSTSDERHGFVGKYTPEGQFLWARHFPGTARTQCSAIITDLSDRVIITGHFRETITIGDTTLNTIDDDDIFLASLNGSGQILWVNHFGGVGNDQGISLSTDAAGNRFLTGYFWNEITIGDSTFIGNGFDGFIAKFTQNGQFIWALQTDGPGSVIPFSIASDGSGRSLLTGRYNGSVTIGDTSFTASVGTDLFIACFSGDGLFLWAKSAGGGLSAQGMDVMFTSANTWLVGGFFLEAATFGDTTLISPSTTDRDLFLAEYSAEGERRWLQQLGGPGNESLIFFANGGNDHLLIAGDFQETTTFGSSQLTSTGDRDSFVGKLGVYSDDILDRALDLTRQSHTSGEHIEMGDVLNMGTGDFTIEAIFSADSFPSVSTFGAKIINKGLAGGTGYGFRVWELDGVNYGRFEIIEGATDYRLAVGGLQTGVCYHLAGVRQGNNMQLYLDGVLVDDSTTAIVADVNTILTFTIGALGRTPVGQPTEFFDGQINEVRVWNTARTRQQISHYMNDKLPSEIYASADSGLVGYYRLDFIEDMAYGSAGINDVRDLSVNGYHGNVFGNPGFVIICNIVGIEDRNDRIPQTIALKQNYPNPFNPTTTIEYAIPTSGTTSLIIYDVLGRKVQTLINEFQHAGSYRMELDGRNLASGTYFYRLKVGEHSVTKKMQLLK